jgi:glycosyltransferase involved in cell wall biosynthesis
VSTTIGAEGLELDHGTHILLADNPHDFAERICALLTNPGIRAKLGDNGRHLVVRHYDWDIAARALNEAWHWAVSPTTQRSGKTETGINPANISVETS